MVEFDDVKESRKYSMNINNLTIYEKHNRNASFNLTIDKEDILDVLTACVDYAKRYGLRDNYGRDINLESLFKVMMESK